MSAEGRQILTVNAGSGSLQLHVWGWESDEPLDERMIDWHGAGGGVEQYAEALEAVLDDPDRDAIAAIGHRVVHGGGQFHEGVLVDDGVKQAIRDLAPLAPLHNPVALGTIEALERLLPGVPQVAASDTAFHHTLPPQAYLYGVPYAWYERWGIRRWGFHGLSHAYCAERAAQLLRRPVEQTRIVTCHLGSGCSLAAIAGGRSVATTMGFTPLEGVVMARRSGSVDPGVLLYLLREHKLGVDEMDEALNHQSGLQGLSGISADMRDILEAKADGDERAALAFEVYTARIREAIGSQVAALGGLEALVFTDGVGENVPDVRAAVCHSLGWLGIALDEAANAQARPDVDIATADSSVRVLVIHAREALMVAREVRRVLANEESRTKRGLSATAEPSSHKGA